MSFVGIPCEKSPTKRKPMISLNQCSVKSSFIQPFNTVAIEHFRLNFSWRSFDSLIPPAKSMKGLHLVLLTLPLRHTPVFSMVVSDIPKCWCFVHSYNARPKKGKLFLQSSNENHLGNDSISWKWWIFLGGCRYSSQWKPMPRLEFFTPASTSYKRFSYCWIFLFVVKRFFLLWTWLFSYSHGASYHPVATPKLLTFIL